MAAFFTVVLNYLLLVSGTNDAPFKPYYDDTMNSFINEDAKPYYITFPETPIGFFEKTNKIARRNMVEEWNIVQPEDEPEF
ncbi:MAG: hypothetical protein ABSG15_07015 [FCB group bacterium]|jgi:hypothetical protein